MAAAFSGKFRVVSLNETGDSRIIVNLVQDFSDTDGPALFTNPMSLNLTAEEANSYFPGQTYTVTLTAA